MCCAEGEGVISGRLAVDKRPKDALRVPYAVWVTDYVSEVKDTMR